MILTLFSLESIPVDLNSMIGSVFDTEAKLGGMIQKSLMGYVIAFGSGILIYLVISRLTEKYFMDNPITKRGRTFWSVAQWFSTAFLWSQWLTQDLANIYIYLKGGLGIGKWWFHCFSPYSPGFVGLHLLPEGRSGPGSSSP
jgi:hypothetical protein